MTIQQQQTICCMQLALVAPGRGYWDCHNGCADHQGWYHADNGCSDFARAFNVQCCIVLHKRMVCYHGDSFCELVHCNIWHTLVVTACLHLLLTFC